MNSNKLVTRKYVGLKMSFYEINVHNLENQEREWSSNI